ncbi:hypothetical protein LQR30_15660 [Chromobacterium piscinae]|uniref:hypothetical protein n=1 Tax=Chromobacterium piscinae TaxID=686831 RepID=UPI001E2E1216|nr:hypothetical protein [Chromobacterium piscinae]MCD4505535.1 hypothetical protein [Chromobacterium piscinae]
MDNVTRLAVLFGALPVEYRDEIKAEVEQIKVRLDALPECQRSWVEAWLVADRLGLAVEDGDPGNV